MFGMKTILAVAFSALATAGSLSADEVEAVIDNGTRLFTKGAQSPEKLFYGKLTLDSKGKIVSHINREGKVTPETKVASGAFGVKKKRWTAGEAIEGGVSSELFKTPGKMLLVRVALKDDGKTIQQILVTNDDAKLERADKEFDAIFKGVGRVNVGGRIAISYVRIELDEEGQEINRFALTVTSATKETQVAYGEYNEKEKKWEARDDVPNGVYGDFIKDPGAKTL